MVSNLNSEEREKQLNEIINLNDFNFKLEQVGKDIRIITEDNIKIHNLQTPLEIYFSDPNVFQQAISRLEPDEKIQLLNISNLSSISSSNVIPEISKILDNKPSSLSNEEIKNQLQSLLDTNISLFEQKRKEYDDLNIKIKELELINPLDLLLFNYNERKLVYLFSLNTNQITKIISKFFIQSLKETSRPLIKTRKGSLDFPRTIKSSMRYEGTPFELKFRSKAEHMGTVKPKIYFLLDISGSQEHGIYMSIPIIYAALIVLKDYDIIVYTSSEKVHSADFKSIQEAERKDLTETRVAGDFTLRFNKKTLSKYINNPHALFNFINRNKFNSYSANDHYFILKSLSDVISEDSIIICLSDAGQLTDYSSLKFNDYIPHKTIKSMKKKLKGKVFSFNTSYPWDEIGIRLLSNKFNFNPPSPSNFNYEDIIFFPTENYSDTHPNLTYGDWAREIIHVLSGFTRKT